MLYAGTNDGVWDWNIVTGDVYYSPRFRQLLGIPGAATGPFRIDANLNVQPGGEELLVHPFFMAIGIRWQGRSVHDPRLRLHQ